MNNFTQRTITGSIYVIAVIGAIIFNPYVLSAFFALVGILALGEFYKNSRLYNIFPNFSLGLLLGLLIYASFALKAFGIENKYFIVASLIVGFSIFIFELFKNKDNPFTNIAYSLLGIIYIMIPMGLTNFVVNPCLTENTFYPSLLLGVIILAWCNDTFAYIVGVKFGKHRLFERISPKKSWEGFFGGLVFVQIASVIIAYLTKTPLQTYDWMIMGLIVTIIGTFGDLVESMFKRQIGVKDSGNILPGHGGILDRFDILFIAIPFIFSYIYLRLN